MEDERLLRLREVVTLANIGKTQIYQRIATGDFPAPVRCGARSVRWSEASVRAWIENVKCMPPAQDASANRERMRRIKCEYWRRVKAGELPGPKPRGKSQPAKVSQDRQRVVEARQRAISVRGARYSLPQGAR